MKKSTSLFVLLLLVTSTQAQLPTVSTFDNLQIKPDTFDNGAGLYGGFKDGDAFFENAYDTALDDWSGFALSNMQDKTNSDLQNQYSTYAKGGPARAYGNFLVGTNSPTITWNGDTIIYGVYVCNTTYAALSMLNGDQSAKKFGGMSGNDPDYLKLTAKGYRNGSITDTSYIYLADYSFSDNAKDYILDYWSYFDLRKLGVVDSVKFSLSSTDNNEFGMITPDYFCIEDLNWENRDRSFAFNTVDDFNSDLEKDTFNNGSDMRDGFLFDVFFYPNNYDFDWGSWTGWSQSSVSDTIDKSWVNQYSSVTGSGIDNSHYMVSFGNSSAYTALDTNERHIVLKRDAQEGAWFTNTTYTYDMIRNGSSFSKKFGGADGTDPDYFRLIITGYGPFGDIEGADTFYLADFRFEDDSYDYIIDDWTYVPLKCMEIGTRLVRITYELQSSDTGMYGMNTPAYFAMDNNGVHIVSVQDHARHNINIYPNPTSNYISIPLNNSDKWQIIGLDGKIHLEGTYETQLINVTDLRSGIYFIKVQKGQIMYTGKFIRI